MNSRALWNLMQEIIPAVGAHYRPVMERLAAQSGLETRVWGLLLGALTLEPQTLSAERLSVHNPYAATAGQLERLAPAIAKGYVAQVAPGEYRLTESGRAETQRFIKVLREAMVAADPLTPAEAEQMVSLLRRLLGVSLATPPPPDTLYIRRSFKLMPKANPALPYIEQAISCLAAYRDDAHTSAWRPSGLSGAALETLTFLWRGETDSLEGLCERLAQRGHPRQVYVQALAELRARGFIEGPDEGLRVTDSGRRFREEVEGSTDRYFYGPWGALHDAEKGELGELLTRLRDGLRERAG
jgi:hypothetical protein